MISRIGNKTFLPKSKGFTPPFLHTKRYYEAERAGFTFIELVLVTVIILILVGLSTPLFKRPFSSIQLRNTCQDLVQLMRYVQTKSIAERKFCRINFDFEKGIFWPTVQDDTQPEKFVKIKGSQGMPFKVPLGISIEGESSFIAFYPDGTSDKADIKISDTRGKTFTVTTQRNTGYVKIEE